MMIIKKKEAAKEDKKLERSKQMNIKEFVNVGTEPSPAKGDLDINIYETNNKTSKSQKTKKLGGANKKNKNNTNQDTLPQLISKIKSIKSIKKYNSTSHEFKEFTKFTTKNLEEQGNSDSDQTSPNPNLASVDNRQSKQLQLPEEARTEPTFRTQRTEGTGLNNG